MTIATTRPVTHVSRGGIRMKRSAAVHLGELSLEVLTDGGERTEGAISAGLERAVRIYLRDKAPDQAEWSFPRHLRDRRVEGAELRVEIDEGLWAALEAEADRQGVSISQMAAHAVLYYAAELDAGRITERVLDDLDIEGA